MCSAKNGDFALFVEGNMAMKRDRDRASPHMLSAILIAVGLAAAGCGHQSNDRASAGSAAPATSHAATRPADVIELPRQILTVKTTRDDITVGAVVFIFYADTLDSGRNSLDSVRVNGATPRRQRILLKQVGKDQFELPATKFEFSPTYPGQIFCIAIKAWFNQLTNQEDGGYYKNLPDRYALLSYCAHRAEPAHENARFTANRVDSLNEFKQALARPFVIRLNDRPLRADSGHWPMINSGRTLSDADLKAIEQLVRDRGERYLIGISSEGRDSALVGVGDQNVWESVRRYRLARRDGTWRIENVETDREYGW
jgi:hypothetical protein